MGEGRVYPLMVHDRTPRTIRGLRYLALKVYSHLPSYPLLPSPLPDELNYCFPINLIQIYLD